MYTLNDDQVSSVETLIGKLNDSLIKSRVEKWLAEVEPTRRVTSEQMEQFTGFATHLPVAVQNFPVAFALSVKNGDETLRREDAGEVAEKAELNALVDDSIAHVADVDAPEDIEETEHTLGKEKGARKTRKSAKAAKASKTKSKYKK